MVMDQRQKVIVDISSLNTLKNKIIHRGDLNYITVLDQLKYLELLSQFPLGCFLINHGYFDSFWTDSLMPLSVDSGKKEAGAIKSPVNEIDDFILNHSPFVNSWKEAFTFFQKLLQERLHENVIVGSIPCGEMRDIFTLDFSRIKNFKVFGVDISSSVIDSVSKIALKSPYVQHITPIKGDAWNLPFKEELDVISSCGLNFYIDDKNKVQELYCEFYRVLKPGGNLIISFLTPPPWSDRKSEWDISKIPAKDLLLEQVLFYDILDLQCKNYNSSEEFKEILTHVGFENICIYYDKRRVFPTVTATKKH